MQKAFNQFKESIQKVRELDALYLHLFNSPIPPDTISDLLRAEIVYIISAFDKLIHELVRIGMIEVFNGIRIQTPKYKNFSISINTLMEIQKNAIPPPGFWFEQEVISKHKHLAFQDPDKIGDALSLIWIEQHKWQKIAIPFGIDEKALQTQIRAIVTRRNQIAHEADYDLTTNVKSSIEHTNTHPNIDFIEKLGETIFNLVK